MIAVGFFAFISAMGSSTLARESSAEIPTNPLQLSVADDSGIDDGVGNSLFDEYGTDDVLESQVADPLYYFNYAMYVVNDKFYFYALKPFARGYKVVVPTPARKGIRNFFHNLMFPVRFVNNLLQGKLEQASDEIGIFLVNSTAGILGFNQVAQKHLNMQTRTEDLGQTLGSFQIKEGFYLMLPLLGPSTLRDTVGRAGDYFITPVNHVDSWALEWGLDVVDILNRTSFRIGDYEALKDAALDPYVAIRDAYIQNRRRQVSN